MTLLGAAIDLQGLHVIETLLAVLHYDLYMYLLFTNFTTLDHVRY